MISLAYVVADNGGGSQPSRGTPANWIWISYRPNSIWIDRLNFIIEEIHIAGYGYHTDLNAIR